MRQQCDDCNTADKTLCGECRARSQARADRKYDELREGGYRSPEHRYMMIEMEEKALYPFGRP